MGLGLFLLGLMVLSPLVWLMDEGEKNKMEDLQKNRIKREKLISTQILNHIKIIKKNNCSCKICKFIDSKPSLQKKLLLLTVSDNADALIVYIRYKIPTNMAIDDIPISLDTLFTELSLNRNDVYRLNACIQYYGKKESL